MSMFLTVYGHINEDVILRVDHLPGRGTAPVRSIARRMGGTAANTALVAASLGVPTRIVARVGRAFPREFLEDLEGGGIELCVEVRHGEGPTCYILSDGEEQMAAIYQGPMDDTDPFPAYSSDYVHFATGPPEAFLPAREGAEGRVSVDPGQEISYRYSRETLRAMAMGADFFFCNEREYGIANAILGEPVERFAKAVVLTLGGRGAELITESGRQRVEAFRPSRRLDTVGAGDAFRGGFYAALYRGMDVLDALRAGNAAACLWIQEGRAPLWDEVEGML
jgi:6-phosphofructokinase 1/ribokinase